MRKNGRKPNQLRDIRITKDYISHPEGSVLVEFGKTKVICNATVDNNVPRFLKGQSTGWVTAEYGMLPRSTNERMRREAKNRQSGRTMEIQRLIGRSLRSAVNLDKIGERTITIDCDVIQADGGTRTASITGGFVALYLAVRNLDSEDFSSADAIKSFTGSVSLGKVNNEIVLDLDYEEDSNAETDMNFVMNEDGNFIEIQGTAEAGFFSQDELNQMISLATEGIRSIIEIQKNALNSV
ncbi:MAG: ribonuclease PH [Gammaproteobacteria bacterium]|jgi:ribonuclease PH|nr:ribonuclease PH [Gammaproteobacteria bacterium]MBT7603830.1 ribonuclease PH [Gammaproteobacteria bacterium]